MTTDEFKDVGRALLSRGWQTRLAGMLGVDGSTVRRWAGAAVPVPPYIAAYLEMMKDRQRTRGRLVYELQDNGTPVEIRIDEAEPAVATRFAKSVLFPGVEDPKWMPSVHVTKNGGFAMIGLGMHSVDAIGDPSLTCVVTRHPDPYHREAYAMQAVRDGHRIATVRHVDHYYTLLVHRPRDEPLVIQELATHRGVIRTVWSVPEAPSEIFETRLATIA